MAYDVRSTAVRVAIFSVLWIGFLVATVLVCYFFIYDVAAPYLAVFNMVQFPIAVMLYSLFDWILQNSAMFRTRPRTLLAMGLAASLVLYYPTLLLILEIIR